MAQVFWRILNLLDNYTILISLILKLLTLWPVG